MKEDLVLIEVFSSIRIKVMFTTVRWDYFNLLMVKYLRGNQLVFLIIQAILI